MSPRRTLCSAASSGKEHQHHAPWKAPRDSTQGNMVNQAANQAVRIAGVLDAVSSSWDGDTRQPQHSDSLGNRGERLIHQRAGCIAGRRSLRPRPGVCSSVQSPAQAGHVWLAQNCSETLPGSEGSVVRPNPFQRPGSGIFSPTCHMEHLEGRSQKAGPPEPSPGPPEAGTAVPSTGGVGAQQMPVVRAQEGRLRKLCREL